MLKHNIQNDATTHSKLFLKLSQKLEQKFRLKIAFRIIFDVFKWNLLELLTAIFKQHHILSKYKFRYYLVYFSLDEVNC